MIQAHRLVKFRAVRPECWSDHDILGAVACFRACSQEEPRESAAVTEFTVPEILKVYAVNYPLAYFAERIAEDRSKVSFPAPTIL